MAPNSFKNLEDEAARCDALIAEFRRLTSQAREVPPGNVAPDLLKANRQKLAALREVAATMRARMIGQGVDGLSRHKLDRAYGEV